MIDGTMIHPRAGRQMRSLRRLLTVALQLAATMGVFGAIAGHAALSAYAAPSSCRQSAPGVAVENNWAWGQTGSWGMPGQQLSYQFQVINYDSGCASSNFVVSVVRPAGFSVSMPTRSISLRSGSSGILSVSIASPPVIVDGSYAFTVSVARAGSTTPASGPYTSATTYYKVYSSDTVDPTLFWPNPSAGQSISGRSFTMNVSSSDDHAVKSVDLYIDKTKVATTTCDDISYVCLLSYGWSLRGVSGQHTATFMSHDWMRNTGVLTVTFTVA
jgi:hypothetical protein